LVKQSILCTLLPSAKFFHKWLIFECGRRSVRTWKAHARPSYLKSPEADFRVQPAARIKNAAASFANQVSTELNGSMVKKKSQGFYVRLAAGLAVIGTHPPPASLAPIFFSRLAATARASYASKLTRFFRMRSFLGRSISFWTLQVTRACMCFPFTDAPITATWCHCRNLPPRSAVKRSCQTQPDSADQRGCPHV